MLARSGSNKQDKQEEMESAEEGWCAICMCVCEREAGGRLDSFIQRQGFEAGQSNVSLTCVLPRSHALLHLRRAFLRHKDFTKATIIEAGVYVYKVLTLNFSGFLLYM